MVPIVLSLGTNLGDRLGSLRRAAEALVERFDITRISGVVESAAMYLEEQPDFLNAAILASTDLGPRGTLAQLKAIERSMGRQMRVRNGPREMDIDLIAYGSLSYCFADQGETLIQVPHPRLAERAFVLKPVAEICPWLQLPGAGSVQELLHKLGDAADAAQWIPDAVLPLRSR